MRAGYLGLALSLGLWAGVAQADGIEDTIRGQIDAFLADDFTAAFGFASPAIKGVFGTPDNFGRMVRNGYPMVHRPAGVRLLDRREVGGQVMQRVMVTDQAGRGHVLEYEMQPFGEGWQIDGVRLLPSAGEGV